VIFYIDGLAYPAPAYDPGFTFATAAAIGARADNQSGGFGAQLTNYHFIAGL